jgi:hypothetical protein
MKDDANIPEKNDDIEITSPVSKENKDAVSLDSQEKPQDISAELDSLELEDSIEKAPLDLPDIDDHDNDTQAPINIGDVDNDESDIPVDIDDEEKKPSFIHNFFKTLASKFRKKDVDDKADDDIIFGILNQKKDFDGDDNTISINNNGEYNVAQVEYTSYPVIRFFYGLFGLSFLVILITFSFFSFTLASDTSRFQGVFSQKNIQQTYSEAYENIKTTLKTMFADIQKTKKIQEHVDAAYAGKSNTAISNIINEKQDVVTVYNNIFTIIKKTKQFTLGIDEQFQIKNFKFSTYDTPDGKIRSEVTFYILVQGIARQDNKNIGESLALSAIFAEQMEKSPYFMNVNFRNLNKNYNDDAADIFETSSLLSITADIQSEYERNYFDESLSVNDVGTNLEKDTVRLRKKLP